MSERCFRVEELFFVVLIEVCFCIHTIVHFCGERIRNSRGLNRGLWLLLLGGLSNESSSSNRTSLCNLEMNENASQVRSGLIAH